MRVAERNIWVCQDCTFIECNGTSGMDATAEQIAASLEGLERIGPYLAPDFDLETGDGINEYSEKTCHACRTRLSGYRARFARLEETNKESI